MEPPDYRSNLANCLVHSSHKASSNISLSKNLPSILVPPSPSPCIFCLLCNIKMDDSRRSWSFQCLRHPHLYKLWEIEKGKNSWTVWPRKQEWTRGNNLSIFANPMISALPIFKQSNQWSTKKSQDGAHRNQIEYIISSRRWKNSNTWSRVGCTTNYDLLTCKFQVKLKQKYKAKQFHNMMMTQYSSTSS